MTTSANDHHAAIVGIGCRLPGGIHDPDQLWGALTEGRDLVSEIPPDRWAEMAAHLHPDQRPAKPWPAGVLADIASFDAEYFGIGPAEAEQMDPQQRLLLETVVEALADAGIAPSSLAGGRVGVYVGAASFDHATLAFAPGRRVSMHTAGGAGMAVLANRISYCLDLCGPSISFDSACSASLVAAHYACRDLAGGDVDLAVVAGANLLGNPSITASFIDGGVLSPQGRCRVLDAEADGYVRSEGVGAVVLKPEAQARIAADRIYALVTGSAINQDGRTPGLYAPSEDAQQSLLDRTLADAANGPGQVDYAELHGTGTKSGDRVEGRAIAAVLGAARGPRDPVAVGSVKTNLGHTEGAAGVVGLIKTALMLHHGHLVASLHHRRMRPALADLPLRVPTGGEPWPQHDHPPRAVVSAFGFGGTNACLVLARPAPPPGDAAPSATLAEEATGSEQAELVPLSAATSHRLGLLADAWAPVVGEECDLGAVAATAIHRRDLHHPRRAAVLATSRYEAAEALIALAHDQPHPAVIGPHTALTDAPAVVWVFAGHGCHHPAMAESCYERFDAFAQGFGAARQALSDHLGRAPWRPGAPIGGFAEAQHAIWMTQTGQAALWKSWGYVPTAVVGHSVGEVTAAHTTGALTLDQAAHLVATRSSLLAQTAEVGGLLAVALPAEQTQEAISTGGYGDALVLAALNGPHSTVVSGAEAALRAVQAELSARGIGARRVGDDAPAHSPLAGPAADQLHSELATLTPHPPQIPMYPTALGHHAHLSTPLDGAYWAEQMRQPVALLPTVEAIAATYPGATWVELAGRSTLAAGVLETLVQAQVDPPRVVAAGHRSQSDDTALLGQLAHLYTYGHPPQHWPYAHQAPVRLPVAWHYGPDTSADTPSEVRLQAAVSSGDHAAVHTALVQLVARILGCRHEDLDVHAPLGDQGIASIATLELRAQLRSQLHGAHLPADLLSPHTTIATLTDTLTRPQAADTGASSSDAFVETETHR